MSDRSVSAAVTVGVDPVTAFAAFTDEIDSWWVRGPINFFDSARAVAMRVEPGVGGRVLEVYQRDALELGRITAWEPGAHLAYRSSVDDTEVDVRFEAADGGTRVSVTQTLVPSGERGFFFWRNVIRWFSAWHEDGRPRDREIARVSIAIHYADPGTAARWLARVFQLRSWSGIPEEGEQPGWAELHHGDVAFLLLPLDDGALAEAALTHVPWVYVDDLDAHFAHAEAAGAAVVEPIHQHGYRAYTAEDLEGRRWTFVQARATMNAG